MIVFNVRSKCSQVSHSIIDISSIITPFKYWYVSHHVNSFITWLFILVRFQSWLHREMKCFGHLRNCFKYSVIALIKKLFLTHTSPLKNIWNGFGDNSLFLSANFQCNCILHYKIEQMLLTFTQLRTYFINCSLEESNKLSILVDITVALLALSLPSKSRSSKLGFIVENSALSSSSDWTRLKFCNSLYSISK